MLIDRARIKVIGGKGGNGCCSFRREKYVPRGGPDGGDGGKGGDVFFFADHRLTSLLDVQFHAHWKGESGIHGGGGNRHGKCGEDTDIHVPPGTMVFDFETDEPIGDLTQQGQRLLAAKGGRGGKGNARFSSSTHQAPHFSEKGEPGEEREFRLELKMIADVGLVGLPNAGKSTFLAAATAARPKIADYPFTTLSPNLGVATLSGYRTITIADIPGIIEGAADGRGLGHDFLRHIERTRVLLFLIDLGDEEPLDTCGILEEELAQHSLAFADKPRIYVLNKADIPANRERFEVISREFDAPFLLSGATHEGVEPLLEHLWTLVERVRLEETLTPDVEVEREYIYEAPYEIERVPDGFRIEGKTLIRMVRMTDFDNDEAVRHLHGKLQRMGVIKALKRMGAQQGHNIYIDEVELEYEEE